jgi:hypothetical protein
MTTLKVSIAPAAEVVVPAGQGPFFLDAIYSRVLESETNSDLSDLPSVVQDTVRAVLDDQLRGSLDLIEVAPSTNIDLCFLGGNGGVRLRKQVAAGEGDTLAVPLTREEVAAITTADPQPEPRLQAGVCAGHRPARALRELEVTDCPDQSGQ